ncbi:hypothetical protein Glove_79g129 [Diversispora epigaea]|uniref:Uncharacterized protein n=1 Tax=Diversispora epigaea TaxID=1348612 RepID=A0A397JAQ7_9GLOM|nr:hypothetical protein Glove_79g129 [Diversispora epigaea]
MEQNTTNNLNEVMNEVNEISISNKPDTDKTPVKIGTYNVILNIFNKILENGQVKTKILMKSFKIECVPYPQFEDIKYIDKGGF